MTVIIFFYQNVLAFSILSIYYLWESKAVQKRSLWKQGGGVRVATRGAVVTVQGSWPWQGQVLWEGPQPIWTFGLGKDQEPQGGGVSEGTTELLPSSWAGWQAAYKPLPPSWVGMLSTIAPGIAWVHSGAALAAGGLSGLPRPPTPSTQLRPLSLLLSKWYFLAT